MTVAANEGADAAGEVALAVAGLDLTVPDLSGLPAGFVWGAATASFQIEGDAEHRGASIWDAFCAEAGRVSDGSDGRVACDHVHRTDQDVALLRGLGVGGYRFSVSWPRVVPGGTGPVSADGLAFYDRLVDDLLAAGIDPWLTLYHWDLPVELQAAGGWASRDVVGPFVDYATTVHAALGDRVRQWTTLNEPWCSAWLGYGTGHHAPGVADHAQAARATHHLLLAHGSAVAAMRAQAPADHGFGIVLNLQPVHAADGADPDVVRRVDGLRNRLWLDPLLRASYPPDVLELLSPALDGVVLDGDLELVAQPLDFLGVNYYHDETLVPADPSGRDDEGAYPGAGAVRTADPGDDVTDMGWPVTPSGLTAVLARVRRDYPTAPPLVVTENGAAYDDEPSAVAAAGADGVVDDPRRVRYLLAHLDALAVAARAGVDVRGYFAWSLLDNFEWAFGYTKRFGLVRVDFETLARTRRRSYEVYRAVIAATSAG
ncbi:MAG: GH1 family beta-glucosidase [Kineosporiaceae bacterium]